MYLEDNLNRNFGNCHSSDIKHAAEKKRWGIKYHKPNKTLGIARSQCCYEDEYNVLIYFYGVKKLLLQF